MRRLIQKLSDALESKHRKWVREKHRLENAISKRQSDYQLTYETWEDTEKKDEILLEILESIGLDIEELQEKLREHYGNFNF